MAVVCLRVVSLDRTQLKSVKKIPLLSVTVAKALPAFLLSVQRFCLTKTVTVWALLRKTTCENFLSRHGVLV